MASKSYGIHDKWTDINKINNVDIKSVDGVIESVKINGEEAGGGGSSDFSTAEVTFSSTNFQTDFSAIMIDEGEGEEPQLIYESIIFGGNVGDKTFNLVLYKGHQMVILPEGKTATVTGSATVEEYYIIVTGDCTITIS